MATSGLLQIVGQTVTGLGYELVNLERSAGGLLRITIDWPWTPGAERFINVQDCERVNRQLHYALEVEAVDYRRLEVSSPGLDRPLRSVRDLERYEGQVIDVTLKAPIGEAAAGLVAANRKKFRGTVHKAEDGRWQLRWSDAPKPKPGRRVSLKKAADAVQVLSFEFDEVKEARLAPVVDFKGRKPLGDTPGTGSAESAA